MTPVSKHLALAVSSLT